MKTTYLKPETEMLYYAAEQLMSASKTPMKEGGGKLEDVPETEATSGNLSRRKDIWADEEEEEEQY